MTEAEAENGATDRHELRKLTRFTAHPGIYADCWCGWQSAPYPTHDEARDAHGRHQIRRGKPPTSLRLYE